MIKRHYIKPKTTQWFSFRQSGYGASEIAGACAEYDSYLAQHTWSDPIKIHMEKINEPVLPFQGNIQSEAGIYSESEIINLYKHYDNDDPDQLAMYRRANSKGQRFNRIICPKCYFTNSKYPWLFYSPDGLDYTLGGWKGNIESKNTNSMEAGKYSDRISPSFICQVMQGLLITEKEYAKICIRIDGSFFEVIHIEPDKEWFDFILEYSAISWQRVLECRKIKIEHDLISYYGMDPDLFKTEKQKEGAYKLMRLEPELTGTEHERKFITDHIIPKQEDDPMEGTQEQWELLVDYKKALAQEKKFGNDRSKYQNQLIVSLRGKNKAEFDEGFFQWKPTKKGDYRFFIQDKLLNAI